jgi:hypothetical protein
VLNVPGQILYGVEALSTNNVYAVGTNSYGPLIVHYDGSQWSTVATPEWGRGGRLAGIDAVKKPRLTSRDDVPEALWAAGNYRPGQGSAAP